MHLIRVVQLQSFEEHVFVPRRLERRCALAHPWPEGDSLTGRQVSAVFDGAQDPSTWPMVRSAGLEKMCLFAGNLTPDPSILRIYQPTCTQGEAVSSSGPIDRFLCACDGHDSTVTISRTAIAVKTERASMRGPGRGVN